MEIYGYMFFGRKGYSSKSTNRSSDNSNNSTKNKNSNYDTRRSPQVRSPLMDGASIIKEIARAKTMNFKENMQPGGNIASVTSG